VEVTSTDLINSYFHPYFNIVDAENKYNNLVFILKNIIVRDWVIADLKHGWIWAGGIKCMLMNIGDMKRFRIGDRIDIVGRNAGVISRTPPGILFQECVAMPTGTFAIPVTGGAAFVPAY
jgi:hypothetical protein